MTDVFAHARVSAIARSFPDRTAVVTDAGALSFADLDRLSDTLAAQIATTGAGPGAVFGLHLDRGAGLVVAIVAVLKSGAAYLPLDRRYPAERIDHMAADAGAKLVITEPVPTELSVPVISLAELAEYPEGEPTGPTTPEDAAYVMFTSGSTGRPKAVQVTHGNVSWLIDGLEATVWRGLGQCRVAWNASASFDASVQQWARLCRGDTLVLLSEDARLDPAALVDELIRHAATDLDIVPSHLIELLDPLESAGLPLRLLVGGEPVPAGLWALLSRLRRIQGLRAWNMYGPTECTVDSTVAVIDGSEPHLGEPLPGTRCYVLDDELQPAVVGELFVAGSGVTLGYRGSPGLTAAAFLPDVFSSGGRMYRTGDMVRRRDGRLEYLHRRDRQVKVRGHRVELGEVEAALIALPQVVSAVAVLRELAVGSGIAAYVVLAVDASVDQVWAGLRAALPGHLLPAALTQLDRIPTGPNGKVDDAALPDPLAPGAAQPQTPSDPVERVLTDIWSQVLRDTQVGPGANFFALGGDSLAAMRVLNRCREQFGVRISSRSLFNHPILSDFAAVVRHEIDVVG